MAPAEPFPGTPFEVPGWLVSTTPDPAVLPVDVGGATAEPVSNTPPRPKPRLPLPRPVGEPPAPFRLGGGGTTEENAREPPHGREPFAPLPESPVPDILGGGGTTFTAERVEPNPPARSLCPLPPPLRAEPFVTLGGGGTI